jgi:hypothetical protein
MALRLPHRHHQFECCNLNMVVMIVFTGGLSTTRYLTSSTASGSSTTWRGDCPLLAMTQARSKLSAILTSELLSTKLTNMPSCDYPTGSCMIRLGSALRIQALQCSSQIVFGAWECPAGPTTIITCWTSGVPCAAQSSTTWIYPFDPSCERPTIPWSLDHMFSPWPTTVLFHLSGGGKFIYLDW